MQTKRWHAVRHGHRQLSRNVLLHAVTRLRPATMGRKYIVEEIDEDKPASGCGCSFFWVVIGLVLLWAVVQAARGH